MRHTPLAGLLTATGLVTTEQIEDANAAARMSGERLGEVIVRHGWANEQDVANVTRRAVDLPFRGRRLAVAAIPRLLSACDPKQARRARGVPAVRFMDHSVVAAIDDPIDPRIRGRRSRP